MGRGCERRAKRGVRDDRRIKVMGTALNVARALRDRKRLAIYDVPILAR